MRSGEVQRSKQGNGKTVHLAIDMWAKPRKNSDWIDIHISVPGNTPTTVTNKPDSPRFHLALFQKLRSILISQNCWPFADKGAEKSEQEFPSDPTGCASTPSPFGASLDPQPSFEIEASAEAILFRFERPCKTLCARAGKCGVRALLRTLTQWRKGDLIASRTGGAVRDPASSTLWRPIGSQRRESHYSASGRVAAHDEFIPLGPKFLS